MTVDPRTLAGTRCECLSDVAAPTTDPLDVLGRLPAALFNLNPPTRTDVPGAFYDLGEYDRSKYDDPGDALDATPQYNLARIVAEEKDRFVLGWRTAEALQLALGRVTVDSAGATQTETPHACGADLDRLGAEFGIGRPYGMTDCCYWRLLLLLLFTPGPTLHQLREIAALYTGQEPDDSGESPAYVELRWPVYASPAPGLAPGSTFTDWQQYADYSAFADATDPGPVTAFDAYARDSGPPGHGDTFLGDVPGTVPGLLLEDALAIAKPAGVAVGLVRPPLPGTTGCLGSTLRASVTRRGMVNAAPEDLGG